MATTTTNNISSMDSITHCNLTSFAKETTLILLSAGESTRFTKHFPVKKQWLRINGEPLWLFLANRCASFFDFGEILLSANATEQGYMSKMCPYKIITGGDSRQDSLLNALQAVKTKWVLVSDVARFGIDYDIIKRLFCEAIVSQTPKKSTNNKEFSSSIKSDISSDIDCVAPTLCVPDTVVYESTYIKRESLLRIQTPQLSKTASLLSALNATPNKQNANATYTTYTDESSAITANGGKVAFIEGKESLHKLTFIHDLQKLADFASKIHSDTNHTNEIRDIFIGNGIDVHSFESGKKMVLGGVEIKSKFGFKAHSDGDVALHSLIDALLGAIGAGDIGEWFPDNDNAYKNADSKELLKKVVDFLGNVGFVINNIDMTIIAQIPKISPYKRALQKSIATLLSIPLYAVNIKATTTEQLGFIGRGEGVCVMTSALLKRFDWLSYAKNIESYPT